MALAILPFLPILAIAMMRMIRPFIVILTVLVFTAMSTAWSVASAAVVFSDGGMHHAVMVAGHADGGHHHGASQQPECSGSHSSKCPSHDHGDVSSACCGTMACHAAIPVNGCNVTVTAFVHPVEHMPLQVGLKEGSTARLERPPRPVGA